MTPWNWWLWRIKTYKNPIRINLLVLLMNCGLWKSKNFWRNMIWVWVNTYRYIFSGMNIHKSQLFWGSLGTRVLTHPHILTSPVIPLRVNIHQPWASVVAVQPGPKWPAGERFWWNSHRIFWRKRWNTFNINRKTVDMDNLNIYMYVYQVWFYSWSSISSSWDS